MGLYNPLLGTIPQPEANSKEVSFVLPKSNYSGALVTLQENEYSIFPLEVIRGSNGTSTGTATMTEDFVLTQINILEGMYPNAASMAGSWEIKINGLTIYYNEDLTSPSVNKYNSKQIIIPNWKIYQGGQINLLVMRSGTGGSTKGTVEFIGYKSKKL